MLRMAVGLGLSEEEQDDLLKQVDDSFWVMRVIGELSPRSEPRCPSELLQAIPHFPTIMTVFPAEHTSEFLLADS